MLKSINEMGAGHGLVPIRFTPSQLLQQKLRRNHHHFTPNRRRNITKVFKQVIGSLTILCELVAPGRARANLDIGESGSSPEIVASDNWSVSRTLQQIEVDEKSLTSKIRADGRGWTFGL
jgi:hypothetical protein